MKKFFTKFLLAIIFSSFFIFSGSLNIANTVNAGTPAKLDNSILTGTDERIINKKITGTKIQNSSVLTQLIPNLFKLVFFLASSLAVLAIVYGGYLMITSLGDDGNQSKGWKVFASSIGGLVLMLMSRAIVGIVSSLKIVRPVDDKKAWDTANGIEYSLGNSSYIGNLPSGKIETEVVPQLIQLALQFVFVVIVGIIIYAGIMYITQPEEKKGKMADLFINAVIGLILILVSYALVAGVLKINFG